MGQLNFGLDLSLGGAVGSSAPALTGEALGNIAWFPFESDLLDATGNHTLESVGGAAKDAVLTPGVGPSGETCLDTTGSGALRSAEVGLSCPANFATTSDVTIFFAMNMLSAGSGTVDCPWDVGRVSSWHNYGLFSAYNAIGGEACWLQGATVAARYTETTTTLSTGVWQHHAFRAPGPRSAQNEIEWYIDGSLHETITADPGENARQDSLARLNFGGLGNATYNFDGYLRHFGITDSLLTPAQIATLSTEAGI